MKLLCCFLFGAVLFGQTLRDTNIRQLTSLPLASLGTPPDGSLAYCNDCFATSPATSGGPGAVVRREAGVWNAASGAAGLGITFICVGSGNDAVGISSAITAINVAGSGVVTPVGSCYNTTVVLMKSNVTLLVPGGTGTTFTQHTAGMEGINFASGSSGMTVDGVTLVNGGILATNGPVSNLVIKNCVIQSIVGTFPFDTPLYFSQVLTKVRIENNRITGSKGGVIFTTVHSVKVLGNRFETCSVNDCIYHTNSGTSDSDPLSSYDLEIGGNTGIDIYRMFIEIQGWFLLGQGPNIHNNSASQWNVAAGGFSYAVSCVPANGSGLVQGNAFSGPLPSATNPGVGVEMGNCLVNGNLINGFGTGVANFGNGQGNIRDNHLTGCGTCILLQSSTSDGVVIEGNQILEPRDYGIVVNDTSGQGSRVVLNNIDRTPLSTDASLGAGGLFNGIVIGSGSSPRSVEKNTIRFLSGTYPVSGTYGYIGISANTSSVPGSLYAENRVFNLNVTTPTTMPGLLCQGGGTELNGSILRDNVLFNLAAGVDCPTTSTALYSNNGTGSGTTPVGFAMVGSNINTLGPTNAQTGTTYTFLGGDCNRVVTFNNSASVAVTLPQAGAGGIFSSACQIQVVNLGAGTVTITPTTSTINLASTLTLATGQGALLVSDGTNYSAMVGKSSGGGSSPSNPQALIATASGGTLTIGGNLGTCSASQPCNVDIGGSIHAITSNATAVVSTGSDHAYVWVDGTGAIIVGVNSASVTCTGCTATTGVTGFPTTTTEIYPIVESVLTSGVWGTPTPRTSLTRLNPLTFGNGLTASVASGRITVSATSTPLGGWLLQPGSVSTRNDVTGAVGGQFTTGPFPLVVTGLGRYVQSGNTGTHTLYIVNAAGNTVLASCTADTNGVTAGLIAPCITSLTLAASTTYYLLSSETNTGDTWLNQIPPATYSFVATPTISSFTTSIPPTSGLSNGLAYTQYGGVTFFYQGGPVTGGYPSFTTVSTPTTGSTLNGSAVYGDELMEIEPAGLIASLTVILENADNLPVGTVKQLAMSQVITSLTVNPEVSGGTISGTAVTAGAVNGSFAYKKTASNTWRRLY